MSEAATEPLQKFPQLAELLVVGLSLPKNEFQLLHISPFIALCPQLLAYGLFCGMLVCFFFALCQAPEVT